jgi:predicted RNA methylase
MATRRNKYAASKNPTNPPAAYRPLNDYETPDDAIEPVVIAMLNRGFISRSGSAILDPACGSGRICRFLRRNGFNAVGRDIKGGIDYLQTHETWDGPIITNPPYGNKLAEKFVRHALTHCTGPVAMLLDVNFLFTPARAILLLAAKPAFVQVIPWRIRFFEGEGDDLIKSQMNNHAWVVWPRSTAPATHTELIFAHRMDA